MRTTHTAARCARLVGLALACLAAACLVMACGSAEGAPSEGASPASERAPRDCGAIDPSEAALSELERCEATLRAMSERLEGSVDGVAAARRAAAIARARALRAGDDDGFERAHGDLRRASRRRGVEGACEASMELVELEARDRQRLRDAYVEAYRLVRRFDGGAHAECVERARRVLAVLASARPSAATLAAIDVDPDGDDPSVGLADEPRPSPTTSDDPFASWVRDQPSAAAVTLDALSVYADASSRGTTRVVLALSALAHFETEELEAAEALPRRFVVALSNTAPGPRVAETSSVAAGGLARVRVRADGATTRVSFDLDGDARATLFVLPDPFRVVVDVREAAPATSAPEVAREVRTIVLDPGHGGDDFGARAFGLMERDITLDLAVRVRDILRTRLASARVVLTREENRFVSLEQRTAIANAIDADAFVSIHLNAAWEDVAHGGVTTFVLDTTNDRQIVRLAARENGTAESEVGALERILAGFHREEQLAGSRALAASIHAATLSGGRRVLPRLYDRGVRSAMFHVLVGARMPAVLLEASFLTRRDEADALRTDRYKQALAEGIADGIVAYARGATASPTASPTASGAPERR